MFVSDETLEPVSPALFGGNQVWEFWGEDDAPTLPTSGAEPTRSGYFPPPSGYRVGSFKIPPTSFVPSPIDDLAAAVAESERLLPGVTSAVTDKEGMHATNTVDYVYILSGEVHLDLDGGDSRILRTGDCVIQNGTKHGWTNRHPEQECHLLVVFFGARRDRG